MSYTYANVIPVETGNIASLLIFVSIQSINNDIYFGAGTAFACLYQALKYINYINAILLMIYLSQIKLLTLI